MNKKVSIIIPAFNVENYIEKCINSILEQSYTNLEVIVVNDGSTDGTLEALKRFERVDKRVRLINKKNEGVSASRNDGIDAATGDYIVFVDADDYVAVNYVEYMINIIKTTNADYCFSTNYYMRKGEKQIEEGCEYIKKINSQEAVALSLSPDMIIYSGNKMYKRDFLIKNNLRFSIDLFYGEGLTFTINVAQKADSVGLGNRKVYYYRRNNEISATTRFDINKMKNGEKALCLIRENFENYGEKIDTINQGVIDKP